MLTIKVDATSKGWCSTVFKASTFGLNDADGVRDIKLGFGDASGEIGNEKKSIIKKASMAFKYTGIDRLKMLKISKGV